MRVAIIAAAYAIGRLKLKGKGIGYVVVGHMAGAASSREGGGGGCEWGRADGRARARRRKGKELFEIIQKMATTVFG